MITYLMYLVFCTFLMFWLYCMALNAERLQDEANRLHDHLYHS